MDSDILHALKRKKTNWIGHILRRNCLLENVFGVKVEQMMKVTGKRRGRK